MPAIDLSATPYYSMVISLAKSHLFSIAIHPMSVVHCKKVNRLRQVCHHWVVCADMDNGPKGSPHSRERGEPRLHRHARTERPARFRRNGPATLEDAFQQCSARQVRYIR